MKEQVESIVSDVHVYSEGLILALKNNKFDEASDYAKKMKKQLDVVNTYLKMKEKIKKLN